MNKLLEKDTNKEAIMAFLRNPEDESSLSKKQKELWLFYVDAYTVIRNYQSVPDAINVLVKLAKAQGKPISAATARRYIYDALDVIGEVSTIKPIAINHLAIEVIMDAISMARDQNDPGNMIKGASKLIAVAGKEDPNSITKDDLQQHIVKIMLDPLARKIMDKLTSSGPIDLDVLLGNAMGQSAEDITYEDIADD